MSNTHAISATSELLTNGIKLGLPHSRSIKSTPRSGDQPLKRFNTITSYTKDQHYHIKQDAMKVRGESHDRAVCYGWPFAPLASCYLSVVSFAVMIGFAAIIWHGMLLQRFGG